MNNSSKIALAMAVKIYWENMNISSDESEDDEIKNNYLPKNEQYYEATVCRFNDEQFKSHFSLTPTTFEDLYRLIISVEAKYVAVYRGHPRIALEKQILMTLWYIANTECFRSVADRFGVSINACWNGVFNISKIVLKINVQNKIISWPSTDRACETADYFQRKRKFAGVIGCIDGSHVRIPAPKEHANSYINRKKFHSVLLQAVCDENMMFIDCYAGEAGSIHDSCLFRRSNLFKKISDGSLTIPSDQHMLGDAGYALQKYLLIPFKNNGNLNAEKNLYNVVHSQVRVTIERAFGLLKNRFRRLYCLNTRRPDFIPLIIMVACILHNFCLKKNYTIPMDFNYIDDFDNDFSSAVGDQIGHLKRNDIARNLSSNNH